MLYPKTQHGDSEAIDVATARDRKPHRRAADVTAPSILIGSPDGDVDAIDPLELAITEVEADARHLGDIADSETNLVYAENDALAAQFGGGKKQRERENEAGCASLHG